MKINSFLKNKSCKNLLCVIEKISLLLFFLSAAVSCATVEKLPGLEKVYITNLKQVNLLPVEDISETVDTIVQLELKFQENSMSLLSYVQADENVIFIEIMNDFMLSMGTIEYDGKSIDFNCSVFPKNLKPEYILNDLQNVYYKTSALKANYSKSKLIFEETKESNKIIRVIKDGAKVIEQIIIEDGSATVKNFYRKYEYQIIAGNADL